MNFRIAESDSSVAELIERELLKALRQSLEQANNEQFVLAANSDQGRLIGGLTAGTSYGWLLIKKLWVDDGQRRKGLGGLLMNDAEYRGREIGCHAAWLETSNSASRVFYEKLGYQVFGELKNYTSQIPESHHRWFMKKSL